MLVTDWGPPGRAALARISDSRARQFWDPQHLVAQELSRIAQQHPEQPQPSCCIDKGFYWDDALVYALHASWKDKSPAVFFNGPVVKVMPGLEQALRGVKR